MIEEIKKDMSNVSDGYHTFNELYNHRSLLFCAFLDAIQRNGGDGVVQNLFKAKTHHDGTIYDGYFIAGCTIDGKQVSYHLDMKFWDVCLVQEVEFAPKWDGHKSKDVCEILKEYLK